MFYDIEKTARMLIAWLFASGAGTVTLIGAYLYAIAYPDVLYVSDFDFGVVDGTQLLAFLVFLPAALLTLRWVYRVNANAQRLASGMSVSPGWNVGWFFVPAAHLWKPFSGVREVWAVSSDPDRWTSVSTPRALWGWWACWVVSDILGWVSLVLTWDVYGVKLVPYLPLDIVAAVISLGATLLLIQVVRDLSRMQAGTIMRHTFA